MVVNGDSGNVSEEKLEILDHEILPGGLWASHMLFVIAASRDHVMGGVIWWPTYHFSNKAHLSCCDHVSDTWDCVEHLSYSAVA
jgi:hypothetical protein